MAERAYVQGALRPPSRLTVAIVVGLLAIVISRLVALRTCWSALPNHRAAAIRQPASRL